MIPPVEKPLITRLRMVLPGAFTNRPRTADMPPFSSTMGAPEKPGCVEPSITTGSVMSGRPSKGWILSDGPLILKLIVSEPGLAFASRIACRREPGPLSLTLVTTNVVAGVAACVAQMLSRSENKIAWGNVLRISGSP